MLRPVAELWHQRGLLGALVLRDLRTRYAGSTVGLVWTVVNPVVQIVILTTVFSYVLKIRLGGMSDVPFPVVLAWALFPWIAIQEGIARATTSLVDGGVMIKRMAFQPGILMAQPVFAAAAQELVALGLLVAIMPVLGVSVAGSLPLCLLPFALQICLTLGIGWILGVLHVYFRDTAQVVVVALQAWFYLTPIVYTLKTAPEALQNLLLLNPLCGIVESFRGFAMGEPVPWGALSWSAAASLLAFFGGAAAVMRARADVADLV